MKVITKYSTNLNGKKFPPNTTIEVDEKTGKKLLDDGTVEEAKKEPNPTPEPAPKHTSKIKKTDE